MGVARNRLSLRGLGTMAVALAIGLLIGTALATTLLVLTPPSVSLEDYAVLVSAAYAREQLLPNAVERLAAVGIGDVPSAIDTLAKQYPSRHPDRPRDAANLDLLASSLRRQSSSGASGAAGGASWALVVIGLAVIGTVLFLASRFASRRKVAAPPLQVNIPELADADLAGGMRIPLGGFEDDPGRVLLSTAVSKAATIASHLSKPSRLTRLPGKRRDVTLRSFICAYHAGDEPFEDVHPIVHEDDDVLVGACGLTASAKLEAHSPARYYAFTAWVHDYLSGEPMCAIGLLSPWATGRRQHGLLDPALTRATLHRAEKGLTATIETDNLLVEAVVADVGYGMSRDVPANSYFTILSVKFTVTIR